MQTQQLEIFQKLIRYQNDRVFIQPICDFFDIQYKNQLKKINSDPFLKDDVKKCIDPVLFGDKRERITFSKHGFLKWIWSLNNPLPNLSLNKKLIEFQQWLFEFLFGAVIEHENAAICRTKIKKLKSLRCKINLHIREYEQKIDRFLDNNLGEQGLIPF